MRIGSLLLRSGSTTTAAAAAAGSSRSVGAVRLSRSEFTSTGVVWRPALPIFQQPPLSQVPNSDLLSGIRRHAMKLHLADTSFQTTQPYSATFTAGDSAINTKAGAGVSIGNRLVVWNNSSNTTGPGTGTNSVTEAFAEEGEVQVKVTGSSFSAGTLLEVSAGTGRVVVSDSSLSDSLLRVDITRYHRSLLSGSTKSRTYVLPPNT
jgi:hypothetical protein